MKEITEEFNQSKLDEMLEKTLQGKDVIDFRIGERHIKISRKLLYEAEKLARRYEVEDVKDIERNYSILSRAHYIPIRLFLWFLKEALPIVIKDKDILMTSREDFKRYNNLTQHSNWFLIPKANSNFTTIYNVYLQNLQFFKSFSQRIDEDSEDFCIRATFEACEMDVTDRNHNSIRGVFVYRHLPFIQGDDEHRQQLEKILAASDAETFDLTFKAMDESYRIRRGKKYFLRGRKLLIESVHKSKREDKQTEDVPDESTTKPLSLVPQLISV